MIALIDNYDSFTWNLVQAFAQLGEALKVYKNDEIGVEALAGADALVISPGPCSPAEAGISVASIQRYADRMPILGVCLGHQSLGAAFGANVVRAPLPMHGKVSRITHDGSGVFLGVESPFDATRYHSLVVETTSLPASLRIASSNLAGAHDPFADLIMGMQLVGRPVFGLQFHPESIMTRVGPRLLENFVRIVRGR